MKLFTKVILGVAASALALQVSAQEQPQQMPTTYPTTLNIPPSDVMFRKTVWRTMDLREKQNRPMFSKNREISKILIEAVQRGELPIYTSDSLERGRTKTLQEFTEVLTVPREDVQLTDEEKKFQQENSSDWGDAGATAAPAATAGPEFYFAKQLYLIELMEDIVFDEARSRMYNDIKAITLYVPADAPGNIRGIQSPLGTFKYSDVVKVFRNDPNALWFNPQNDAQHKNLADAFSLRLFSSYITKVSNPGGDDLVSMYGSGKQSLFAAQRIAEEIIEYESSLWSF